MRRAGVLVALVVLPSLTGCGTMVNLSNSSYHQAYGGVRFDGLFAAGCLQNGVNGLVSGEPDKFPPEATIALAGWALLDLPFSAVGDTVTLPLLLFSTESTKEYPGRTIGSTTGSPSPTDPSRQNTDWVPGSH